MIIIIIIFIGGIFSKEKLIKPGLCKKKLAKIFYSNFRFFPPPNKPASINVNGNCKPKKVSKKGQKGQKFNGNMLSIVFNTKKRQHKHTDKNRIDSKHPHIHTYTPTDANNSK